MPDSRNFFGQLNQIRSVAESTCHDKWHAIIETALPAAGDAMIVLVIPSASEIIENYLEPRGRRSDPKKRRSGHGRRQLTRWGHARWWKGLAFPDIDQIIANRLPGAEIIQGRQGTRPTQWIFRGINLLDRVLWYWMLIDIGRVFIANWNSGIAKSEFCTSPTIGGFFADVSYSERSANATMWSSDTDLVVEANQAWTILPDGRITRDAGIGSVNGPCAYLSSGQYKRQFGPDPHTSIVQLRIQWTDNEGANHAVLGQPVSVDQGQKFECSVTADLTLARFVLFERRVIDGPMSIAENSQSGVSLIGQPA